MITSTNVNNQMNNTCCLPMQCPPSPIPLASKARAFETTQVHREILHSLGCILQYLKFTMGAHDVISRYSHHDTMFMQAKFFTFQSSNANYFIIFTSLSSSTHQLVSPYHTTDCCHLSHDAYCVCCWDGEESMFARNITTGLLLALWLYQGKEEWCSWLYLSWWAFWWSVAAWWSLPC